LCVNHAVVGLKIDVEMFAVTKSEANLKVAQGLSEAERDKIYKKAES